MWSRRATGLFWYGFVLVGGFAACGPTRYGSRPDESAGTSAGSVGGKEDGGPAVAAGGRGPMTGATGGVATSGGAGPIMMPLGGYGPDPVGGYGPGGAPPVELPPGISDHASTVECGSNTCASVPMFGNSYHMDPCCAAGQVCGVQAALLTRLDIEVEPECQPLRQAGSADASCQSASGYEAPVGGQVVALDAWPGCCRADTGTCGVLVNRLGTGGGLLLIAEPRWGCMDGEPFFPGEAPVECGAGGAGQGGAGPDLPEAGGVPNAGGFLAD